MGHVDYNGPNLMFSGNAGELTYTVSESESLSVRNGLTGSEKLPVRCIKDGTARMLKVSNVLESLPLHTADLPGGFGEGFSSIGEVEAAISRPNDIVFDSGGDEVELRVIPGMIGAGNMLNEAQLGALLERPATVGPKVRKTAIGSQDYLSFFIYGNLDLSVTDHLYVSVSGWTHEGRNASPMLAARINLQGNNEFYKGDIITFPLNNHAILSLFWSTQRVYRYMVESILLNNRRYTVPAIEFIVHNGSAVVTDFAFLNDLGGIDSIHAFGGRTDVPNFTTQTFINDSTEKVLRIDEEKVIEAQSGPIQSGAERSFWMSFLRSTKKWWIRDGIFGREAVSIIVEDCSPEMANGTISEIKFRFRTVKKEGIGKIEGLTL